MKIILGSSAIDRTDHARELIKTILSKERSPNNTHMPSPIGIATHLTHYPSRCDECGESYWASDPYADHALCKGPTRGMGFK